MNKFLLIWGRSVLPVQGCPELPQAPVGVKNINKSPSPHAFVPKVTTATSRALCARAPRVPGWRRERRGRRALTAHPPLREAVAGTGDSAALLRQPSAPEPSQRLRTRHDFSANLLGLIHEEMPHPGISLRCVWTRSGRTPLRDRSGKEMQARACF